MKATNYLFPLVAMAISATALAAQEQNPNAPRFEKIALPEKSIEVFYSTLPVSVVSPEQTLVIGKGKQPATCNMFLQKGLEKVGIKADTSSFGTSHDLTCEFLYRGTGAGVYGEVQEENRSLISYLGQGLGIATRIGLAVVGGKAALDVGGAGAANVVATSVLTDTRANIANGQAAGVVERNTLFGDKEFVQLMRVCHPATKQCGVVLGVLHKETVQLEDKLMLMKTATDALVSAANVTTSSKTSQE